MAHFQVAQSATEQHLGWKDMSVFLLDASWFTDPASQQAVELETVLTPVKNTLRSQQQSFLIEDYFISLVLHPLPKAMLISWPEAIHSNQQGQQGQQAVPAAPHPIAQSVQF